MIEVFGIDIGGDIMYSNTPKNIAVEALAYMGVDMDFTEAVKAYEYNYEGEARSYYRQQELSESGEKAEFFRKYMPFRTAIRKVRGCYKYEDYPEIQFIRKQMTEKEFYSLREYS